ncbi:MAG: class I SAM-dependent methyltransferase, partial [Planctomyces sp.]
MKWDTGLYDDRHAFVTQYGEGVLELLNPAPGERILDIGCGTGHLTRRIADSGACVVGLDSSVDMIAAASKSYPEIEFLNADAAHFRTDEPFDAIFSNAALHWILLPEDAVRCMSAALRPGGRLVVEFGGRGNVHQICSALERAVYLATSDSVPAKNYFPSISEYTTLLEKHDIEVTLAMLFDRDTKLDGGEDGLRAWLQMFRGPVLDRLTEEQRQSVLSDVTNELRPRLFRDGSWFADYRRIRVVG